MFDPNEPQVGALFGASATATFGMIEIETIGMIEIETIGFDRTVTSAGSARR